MNPVTGMMPLVPSASMRVLEQALISAQAESLRDGIPSTSNKTEDPSSPSLGTAVDFLDEFLRLSVPTSLSASSSRPADWLSCLGLLLGCDVFRIAAAAQRGRGNALGWGPSEQHSLMVAVIQRSQHPFHPWLQRVLVGGWVHLPSFIGSLLFIAHLLSAMQFLFIFQSFSFFVPPCFPLTLTISSLGCDLCVT